MSLTPKRGDIVRLTLDPALGVEQQGARPVLVLSPEAFNKHGGALICPSRKAADLPEPTVGQCP